MNNILLFQITNKYSDTYYVNTQVHTYYIITSDIRL